MSLTIEQSDAAILATFHSMEENIEYVLNDHWFAEGNQVRKEYDYVVLKDKNEYIFSRKGKKLFVNGKEIFDFKNKVNLAFAFALPYTLALALQNNGIEKLNTGCEGKVVEIDGKKYKLTAV